MSEKGVGVPSTMRIVFGIFMICIYLGMGTLMFLNFFSWTSSFDILRYALSVLFVVYGFWRGYRQFSGRN